MNVPQEEATTSGATPEEAGTTALLPINLGKGDSATRVSVLQETGLIPSLVNFG